MNGVLNKIVTFPLFSIYFLSGQTFFYGHQKFVSEAQWRNIFTNCWFRTFRQDSWDGCVALHKYVPDSSDLNCFRESKQ